MPIASKRDDASLLNHEFVRFDEFFGAGPASDRQVREMPRPGAAAGMRPAAEKNRTSNDHDVGCDAQETGETGATGIPFGAARYDGLAYLVIAGADPALDLRSLWRTASESRGSTRYGSPGKPTLYAALDRSSAIAEACYHALDDRRHDSEVLSLAMYQLRVRGRFADLLGRERHHPELVADDYRATRGLAQRVRGTRLHGVLYPSARSSGFCLAAFTERVFRSLRFVDVVSMKVLSDQMLRLSPACSARWRLLHRDELRRYATPRRCAGPAG